MITLAIASAVNAAAPRLQPDGVVSERRTVPRIIDGPAFAGKGCWQVDRRGSQGSQRRARARPLWHHGDVADLFACGTVLAEHSAGTGVFRLRNALVLKGSGYAGGNAIVARATDTERRPGEMVFENVLIYGQAGAKPGVWDRGLYVDGAAADVAGSSGVRSIELVKSLKSPIASGLPEYVLDGAVHFSATHLQLTQAMGRAKRASPCEVCPTTRFSNATINGTMVISGSRAMNVALHGRVSQLIVTNPSVVGVAAIQSEVVESDAHGFRVMSNTDD